MGTSVINKKQKNNTLSSKKLKPKQVIKYVLATPFANQFWPEVNHEDYIALKEILETYLPRIMLPKVNIPWKRIKHVEKSDRKRARLELMKKMGYEVEIDRTEGEGLVLGINEVTKCLESNFLDAVLIASDVHPRLMVQHVIEQSVLKGTPVLVVKNLRTLTLDKCGVKTVALGITKDLCSDSKLNIIKDTVREISEQHPIPTNHINYRRSVLSAQQDNMDEKMETSPIKQTINIENVKQEFYLLRDNKRKRIFVPDNVDPAEKMEVDNQFLPLSEEVIREPKKFSYRSLKVKKLRNNVNRIQKESRINNHF